MKTKQKRTDTARTKWCWVARETRRGWRLKFCGTRDYPVRGLLLKSRDDVERVTASGGVVFVHMKGTVIK